MSGLTGLTSEAVAGSSGSRVPVAQPRLVKAAHEFEASMMTELMKPLTAGGDLLGESEEESGSSNALTSFAGEALSKAISDRGGFGMATSIIHQLSSHQAGSHQPGSQGNHSGTTSVTGSSPNNALKPFTQ